MSRYSACCRFTVVGDALNDTLKLAGLLTDMGEDANPVAKTAAPELLSAPCAETRYCKYHGFPKLPGSAAVPVYVNETVAPETMLAEAGTGALSPVTAAVEKLVGGDNGDTFTAVAWPELLTATVNVKIWPTDTPVAGAKTTDATVNTGRLCTVTEIGLNFTPELARELLAEAVNAAQPEVVKLKRYVKKPVPPAAKFNVAGIGPSTY
jgi:hypothetical protein